jgi:serine/threonine-protein kinase
MTEPTRSRVDELFDRLVDADDDARQRLLDAECDAPLRDAVERLLRADARAARFMERPPAKAASLIDDIASGAPRQFGPYRVLRPIGAGGMGQVWLAERSDGEFEQRVAIKQLAYPTPGLLTRFRQERQILARLEHQNIARLIDGGVGADGAPYLVMEYVDGVPITTYARDHALDVPSVLRLFVRVCDAVQFAHQTLVVHRDLKPSNIFVAADGTPKLLDFGIAKVLTATETDAPTQTAARLLTPDYAAPEQFTGAAVTTATDVYALGVVLYELLAGTRPTRSAHGERDVRPPSAAIDTTTGFVPSRRRALRGDLDRIALTALAADPKRRYPTAQALAADIERFLDGRPIAARGDHALYRLGKFARRNRYALAGAVLVFAVCIAATAISLDQARRAREQAARTDAVRKFLVGVFAQASPDQSKGKPITAHELLEKSEKELTATLGRQPALHADVTTVLASLYADIGDDARAEALFKASIDVGKSGGVPAEIRSRTLASLASLERDKHDNDAAIGHANEALALAESVGAAGASERSAAEHVINAIMVSRGDAKTAEPRLREMLARDRALYGEDSDEIAADYLLLGTAYDELSRYDDSAAMFARALATSRALHGDQHDTTLRALNDFGLMQIHSGDLDGAEKALRETATITTAMFGADTDNSWTTRSNLIRVLELKGRYREALAEREAILAAEERLVSETRPDALAFATNFIGIDHRELGELDAAEASLRRSLSLWKKIQGDNAQPASTAPMINLALTLALKGEYAEAEQLLRATLAIQRQHDAPDSQWLNLTRGALGNVLRLDHRAEEALVELRAANTAMGAKSGANNPWLILLGTELVEGEIDAGHAADAARVAKDVLATARRTLPEHNMRLALPLYAASRAELANGDANAAESHAREARALRSEILPPDDPRRLEVDVVLAGALQAQGKGDEAAAIERALTPRLAALATPYAADLRRRLAGKF